jgi:hypothetical protein
MKLTPSVNFINVFRAFFSHKFSRQSQNVTRKAAKKNIRTKKECKKNVDEIDG